MPTRVLFVTGWFVSPAVTEDIPAGRVALSELRKFAPEVEVFHWPCINGGPEKPPTYQGAIEEMVRAANAWLERLLGPPATEIGELFADRVRHWRARQAVALVLESQSRLNARHVEAPRAVAPTVLIPLL